MHRLAGTSRPTWLRYTVAPLAVVLAWAIRTLLDPALGDIQPFATFYIAVTLVAAWAGWQPAVLTTIAGYFVAHWFFLPPRHVLAVENLADVVQHLTYFFVTGTIVVLISRLRLSQRRATESAQTARQNEQRFRAMAETVPDIVFTWGPDGAIDFLSRRFYQYTGLDSPISSCDDLLHPEDAAPVQANWRESLRTGRPFQAECRLRAADGSYHWFLRRASPIRDEQQRILKWVGSCTDIDQQKRHSELLEQRVAERTVSLRETVEELEHFSYSIAHDMRAPLRAMAGYATLLQEELCAGCLRQPNLELLHRIQDAAHHMDRLIQDILNYSRVVHQSLPLHPVDLSHVLHDLLRTYPNLIAHASAIELRGDFPPVLGNEVALALCFANLFDNALKFVHPETPPQVIVWAQPNGPFLRVSVQDNGIGIAPQAAQRIFNLFQRAAPAEYQGTGLGLAITRKLVRRMNGHIGVDPAPGIGSRFWVDLCPAPQPPRLPTAQPSSQS